MNAPFTPPSRGNASVWLEPLAKLEGLSLMDHLFNRLEGMYPNLWRASFRVESSLANWRAAWAEAFSDEAITPHEIATGLTVCRRRHEMPPSLPQFLRACRPQANSDPEPAFYDSADQMVRRHAGQQETWPSPRHFWAAQRVGGDMLHLGWRELAGRWRAAWEQAAADADRPIPVAAPREQSLPAPGKTTRSEAEVSRMLSEAREQARKQSQDGQQYPDGLDLSWTEPINKAPASYPCISLQYAHAVRTRYGLSVSDALLSRLGMSRGSASSSQGGMA